MAGEHGKGVFILGRPGSGKTAILLGLALWLKEMGKKPGYLKPIGYWMVPEFGEDADARLMQKALGLDRDLETICPFPLESRYLKEEAPFSKAVLDGVLEKARSGRDALLVDGPTSLWKLASAGLDAWSLMEYFRYPVLYAVRPRDGDRAVEQVLVVARYAQSKGVPVAGVLFNSVQPHETQRVEKIYRPLLERHQVPYLGSIPYHTTLSAPNAAVYLQMTAGRLLVEGRLDRPVEHLLIGAMTAERALSYFRRYPHVGVITGGDRADVALAALETDISLLILTGGNEPDARVLSRAKEKEVPVLLAVEDTFTVAQKVESISRILHPDDRKAIEAAHHAVKEAFGNQFPGWLL
ncbi:MAG: DRTGG domain-containing protein [Bacillota bacterium]|nr:DRTGG domain-containing protein [Bacillota bacterium]